MKAESIVMLTILERGSPDVWQSITPTGRQAQQRRSDGAGCKARVLQEVLE
jgi:hypothetical protein